MCNVSTFLTKPKLRQCLSEFARTVSHTIIFERLAFNPRKLYAMNRKLGTHLHYS